MRHYVIGQDRCLVHIDSQLLEGWEKCTDISVLQAYAKSTPAEIEEGLNWKGSKMPADLMKKVLGTINMFKQQEVLFSLYYRLKDNTWAINVPKQYGKSACVDGYDAGAEVGDGYLRIGSIHTHPEMGAFWSGVDLASWSKSYGVHFVFGLKDGKVTSTKCTIFSPTNSYDKEFTDFCEPVDFSKEYPPVKDWVDKIEAQELKSVAPETPRIAHSAHDAKLEWKWRSSLQRYDRDLLGEDLCDPLKLRTCITREPAAFRPAKQTRTGEDILKKEVMAQHVDFLLELSRDIEAEDEMREAFSDQCAFLLLEDTCLDYIDAVEVVHSLVTANGAPMAEAMLEVSLDQLKACDLCDEEDVEMLEGCIARMKKALPVLEKMLKDVSDD